VTFLRLFLGDLLAEYAVPLLLSAVFTVILVFQTVVWSLGVMEQPGGIYWLASLASPEVKAQHPLLPVNGFDPQLPPDQPIPGFVGPLPVFEVAPGAVSDVDRYRLAVSAGFVADEAILAVAVSIAEDGSGRPDAVSPPNWNLTRDIGLMQINSAHIDGVSIPSMEWLFVPINNFRAGFAIRLRQGWCAWSTYLASCGVGHNGAFAAYMGRARQAATAVQGGA
jgi:hypothetical protein